MAYVLSTVTCGIVESVDVSEALAMPGVVGYVDHNDMPGSIYVCQGETLVFAAGKVENDTTVSYYIHLQVHYWGQPVGAIVAETHETARRAASLVKVNIAAEKPIITTEVGNFCLGTSAGIFERTRLLGSDPARQLLHR